MGKITVALFDFDGTITSRDTFVPFLFKSFGYNKVLMTFFRLAPRAMLVGIGCSNRDRLKEYLVQSLFYGESVEKLREIGSRYGETLTTLYRVGALRRIEWHKSKGHRCIMVSASLDLYLENAAKSLGFDDLLCTVLSHNNQFFDGMLKGGNCRRMAKVTRIQAILGDLKNYEIYAYGDSIGDREMLAIAEHGYYRPFEIDEQFKKN